MKIIFLFCFFFFLSCSSPYSKPQDSAEALSIIEVNPNKWTFLTRKNLEHLLKIYDLNPILFTKEVHIESRIIPHSHPILTLNTKYAEEPFKLLSVFIHEQLHWWLEKNNDNYLKMKPELERLYPELPTSGVAKDPDSTYLHLALCTIEYDLLVHYLGENQAKILLRDLIEKDKIYPWVYAEVFKNFKNFKTLIISFNLRPDI